MPKVFKNITHSIEYGFSRISLYNPNELPEKSQQESEIIKRMKVGVADRPGCTRLNAPNVTNTINATNNRSVRILDLIRNLDSLSISSVFLLQSS